MQKYPTWREVRVGGWGWGAWRNSWLLLLVRTSLPWKHICLLFSATHLFCILRSPSHSSNGVFFFLFTFNSLNCFLIFKAWGFLLTFHATCEISPNFVGIERLVNSLFFFFFFFFFFSSGFFGLRTRRRYNYPERSVLHANMCRLYSDHNFRTRQSYLMAACIKTIKLCPSPATTIICGCVGWNLARNYHFLNHFTPLALCLFHSFSSSISSLSSLKDLEPPACSSFLLLFSALFFSSLSNSTFLCVQMLSERRPFFPFRLDVIVAACGLGVFI